MNNKNFLKSTRLLRISQISLQRCILLFIVFILSACGGGAGNNNDKGPSEELELETGTFDEKLIDTIVEIEVDANLSVAPSSGPPGTPLSISGLNIPDEAREQLVIFVGLNSAPLIPSKSGQVMTAIPLGAAGVDGKTLPDKPLSLYVYQYGELIASIDEAVTVEAIPEAPGSVKQLRESYTTLATELERVSTQFFTEDSIESIVLDTYAKQISDLINGDHEHSIKSILGNLEQEDPQAFAFVESILASAGYIDALQNFVSGFQSFSYAGRQHTGTSVEATRSLSPGALLSSISARALNSNQIIDTDLAEQMLALEELTLIGQVLIHDNAEQIGIAVGLLSGALSAASGGTLALVGGVLSLVGAVMGVVDFLYNKVWLGTYPSQVSAFELVANSNVANTGDAYSSVSFNITVANKPQPVGINDLVSLTLAGMGIASSANAIRSSVEAFNRSRAVTAAIEAGENFSMNVSAAMANNATLRQEVADLISFITGNAQAIFSAVASRVPNANLDQNIFSNGIVFSREWKATINTPHLLNLVTNASTVLDPIDGQIAWQASSLPGIASVSAFTDPFYWGVAERSNSVDVSVIGNLSLQVTIPKKFNAEQVFNVSVSGSYEGPHGVVEIDDTPNTSGGSGFSGGASAGAGGLSLVARSHTSESAPAIKNGLVEITVENGSSDVINRTLDAQGHAEFSITPEADVQSVKLNFKLSDPLGSDPVELPVEVFLNQTLPGVLFIEHEPIDGTGARSQEQLLRVSISSSGVGSVSTPSGSKNDFKISTFLNASNEYYLRTYYRTGETRIGETSERLEAVSSYDQYGTPIAHFGELIDFKSDSGAISLDGSKTAIVEMSLVGADPDTGNNQYEEKLVIYNSFGETLETHKAEALGLTGDLNHVNDIVQWLPDGRLVFAEIQWDEDILNATTTLRTYLNGSFNDLMILPSVGCETVRLASLRPQVSRDSRYLILSCRNANSPNETLVLIDTINISLTNLYSGTGWNTITGGSISSDNRFVTYSDSDQQGLYIYDIQEASTTGIFSVGTNIYSPTWGPEDVYIYYIQNGMLKRINPADPSNIVVQEIVEIGGGRSLLMGFGNL